jgi:putative glutamine amidotransferase
MMVLVSMRIVDGGDYTEPRDAISHDWGHLFEQHHFVPILVPNALDDLDRYFNLDASGLLLTGGDDLGPEGRPTRRDLTEIGLIGKAIAAKLPIFGVCRGLQILNRYFGGRIDRKLPENHVGEHDVRLQDGSTQRVNSFHNNGVMLPGIASGLVPFAVTEAGVVEAMRHPELPITAIQWHPERPSPSATLDGELIRRWLATCG